MATVEQLQTISASYLDKFKNGMVENANLAKSLSAPEDPLLPEFDFPTTLQHFDPDYLSSISSNIPTLQIDGFNGQVVFDPNNYSAINETYRYDSTWLKELAETFTTLLDNMSDPTSSFFGNTLAVAHFTDKREAANTLIDNAVGAWISRCISSTLMPRPSTMLNGVTVEASTMAINSDLDNARTDTTSAGDRMFAAIKIAFSLGLSIEEIRSRTTKAFLDIYKGLADAEIRRYVIGVDDQIARAEYELDYKNAQLREAKSNSNGVTREYESRYVEWVAEYNANFEEIMYTYKAQVLDLMRDISTAIELTKYYENGVASALTSYTGIAYSSTSTSGE